MQSQGVPATLISNIMARVHHDLAPASNIKTAPGPVPPLCPAYKVQYAMRMRYVHTQHSFLMMKHSEEVRRG